MSEAEFVFVYSTFPDRESAERVAQRLVVARLAACVNILPPMTSIFEWQGTVDVSTEHAVFIKTRRTMAEQAIAVAQPLHPYSLPCFLVLPILAGNEDYLAWVRDQTLGP